jgi:AcrR family transcriptional regulator
VRASVEILEQEGPDALTVQAIVDRAGSSVGSFYARFGGKDDLLDYLGARLWRDASERWEQALASRDWDALDLAQLAEGSARLLLEAERSHASYLKALGHVAGKDDAYEAFRAHLLEGLERLFVARGESIDHLDPVMAVRVGLRAVLGIVSAKEGAGWAPPPERIVLECREVLLSYLQPAATRAGAPPGGQVDFFDVWG